MPRKIAKIFPATHRFVLDKGSEAFLIQGHFFNMVELPTYAFLSEMWQTWGERIETAWVEAIAGSRPAWLYASGEIELPKAAHRPTSFPVPAVGGKLDGLSLDWLASPEELDHLQSLGMLKAAEVRAAGNRFDTDPYPTRISRYRFVADHTAA